MDQSEVYRNILSIGFEFETGMLIPIVLLPNTKPKPTWVPYPHIYQNEKPGIITINKDLQLNPDLCENDSNLHFELNELISQSFQEDTELTKYSEYSEYSEDNEFTKDTGYSLNITDKSIKHLEGPLKIMSVISRTMNDGKTIPWQLEYEPNGFCNAEIITIPYYNETKRNV